MRGPNRRLTQQHREGKWFFVTWHLHGRHAHYPPREKRTSGGAFELQPLKGATALQANRLLRWTGETFWQAESYDHWVGAEKELERTAAYIENNPVNARIQRAEDYEWPSTGKRRRSAEESGTDPQTEVSARQTWVFAPRSPIDRLKKCRNSRGRSSDLFVSRTGSFHHPMRKRMRILVGQAPRLAPQLTEIARVTSGIVIASIACSQAVSYLVLPVGRNL
jgi:hypothetical protein